MSQLQVTGEAKIRDIQGPVVANSGVITALDGAASQYVRGDGTLADFPTSTGGGSSVSYYLNSSVSQGTIGGVAYRQLSKTPISGAGTDITASTNGYIASYITDANDPSLLEVPAGNFNCEFYFSVNSNNHNPYVYAELYKYNGTTFTLLGSNVAIPEYLTNGTTLSAYYFAIPVAVAALTITDRLAIRIYANVDGRVVTLHTENNHLCQVVTTFSKGLTTLNNLTRQVQFLGTGTSGTDFNIASSVATHTFNLPVASATNTGKLSSTDWSTFNNKVPYTGATTNVNLGVYNLTANQVIAGGAGVNNAGTFTTYDGGVATLLIGSTGNLKFFPLWNPSIGARINAENSAGSAYIPLSFYASNFYFHSNVNFNSTIGNGTYTYTLPSASGTLALTSNLSAYLPLAGGTLTGPLSGTSATFSGLGTFNQLTMTGATAGRIFYAQTGGIVSQSGNLNWDNTNEMLGVGTPNPTAVITAFSNNAATQFKASGNAPAFTFSESLTTSTRAAVFGLATANNQFITGTAAGDMAIANQSTSAGAIVFGTGTSERMRMNSAGRFLIGTSADNGALLQVAGAATFSSTLQAGAITSSVATGNGSFYINNASLTNKNWTLIPSTSGAETDLLFFYTGTSAGTRMTITNGGNVGIGTSSPTDTLHLERNGAGLYNSTRYTNSNSTANFYVGVGGSSVPNGSLQNNAYIYNAAASALIFATSDTERMRITSGGDVLIGTTINTGKLRMKQSADSHSNTFTIENFGNTNTFTFLIGSDDNLYLGYNGTSKGVTNNSTGVYTPLSDINKKKDFEDSTLGLNAIMGLKPTLFRMKEEDESVDKTLGFIAQQVKEFIPQAYVEGRDFIGLSDRPIIAALVKAVQELKQELDELKNK